MTSEESRHDPVLSPEQARDLLGSMPHRPRRIFTSRDHISTAATLILSFAAGVIALAGYPWWATPLALGAIVNAHGWIKSRLERPNEPRLKGVFVATAFTIWLLIPIWRGLFHGETIPFPEALIFAGLAPAAWLVLYFVLLIRR